MKQKIKYVIWFCIVILISNGIYAQKKIKVTTTGKYEARDLTLEEVKNKAIDEAKRNAMVEAGISENVQVSDFLYTFEDDEKFKDIFQSFVSTETGADIIVEEVRETNRVINEFGNILVEVEIDAVIYKHKKERDPTFQFKVEGVREFYYENDPLEFNFKPSQDGYLKVFNVTDDTAFILYPFFDSESGQVYDELDKLFKKNEKVNFPINTILEYTFEIDRKNKDKEYNLLIFVFTKEDIPFMDEVYVENIMKWMYEIPLDERAVEQFGFVVRK